MSVFRFKQFDITNVRSAMKVNTDGVLLGAAVGLSYLQEEENWQVLDVGTGTGTIALMLAQRLTQKSGFRELHLTGIDIDKASAEEAAENFSKSPWAEHLEAHNLDLCRFGAEMPDKVFDLIVSNPPYFDCSLKAPEERRNAARHTDSLSYKELMDFSLVHLKEGGRLAVILPSDVEKTLLRYGRMCSLFPVRILRIQTTPKKQPARIIVEFIKGSKDLEATMQEELLTLQEGGQYTAEYTRLVHEFYLWA